jgi:hypothetical protein
VVVVAKNTGATKRAALFAKRLQASKQAKKKSNDDEENYYGRGKDRNGNNDRRPKLEKKEGSN